MTGNLYSSIPTELNAEIVTDLLNRNGLRIERILSRGQTAPATGEWYDQDEHEWVLVLEGAATIVFEDGEETRLRKGDYLNIAAHRKHRVSWTDPDQTTLWLAVFYT